MACIKADINVLHKKYPNTVFCNDVVLIGEAPVRCDIANIRVTQIVRLWCDTLHGRQAIPLLRVSPPYGTLPWQVTESYPGQSMVSVFPRSLNQLEEQAKHKHKVVMLGRRKIGQVG